MAAKPSVKKISTTNTKQEMLNAYNDLVTLLEQKNENEVNSKEKIVQKEAALAIETADSVNSESIHKKLSELKFEFNSSLNSLSEKIESEFEKYINIKKAVSLKESELQEIFEIQKKAQTLYALIEAQKEEKENFEAEMEELKEELEFEIKEKRLLWEKEKTQRESENKERDKQELAIRNREKEEYYYKFQREQQLAKDKFETEKAALTKELSDLREKTEKDLQQREKNILDSETELKELRLKVAGFPKELSSSIEKAIKDATERIILESKHKEQLLNSSFDGEKKSLLVKIEVLEKTIKEQNDLLAKYSVQLDKSYLQIQDIATKAVQGSGNKVIQAYQPTQQQGV